MRRKPGNRDALRWLARDVLLGVAMGDVRGEVCRGTIAKLKQCVDEHRAEQEQKDADAIDVEAVVTEDTTKPKEQ